MSRSWFLRLCIVCYCAVIGGPLLAQPPQAKKKELAAISPATAGPDFEVQGEYGGLIADEHRSHRVGWQVIALGDGKFKAVEYAGGLPGDGWDGMSRRERDGQRQGRHVAFAGDADRSYLLFPFSSEVWVRDTADGGFLGVLHKVARASPTLGALAPPGAIVLFDGKSVEHFQGGRVTDDGLLQIGATTRRPVRDFSLHLEFRTPFMPTARGQARGNSGVYIQRRYEVQILDSFGLPGEANECGGLYRQRKPEFNMCLPPLSWQTYDIDFRAARFAPGPNGSKTQNARITVRLNGVTVHRDVQLTGKTGAGQEEGLEPLPILLQNHGNPVHFRNIWLLEK
jgi:hypothetical protein